MATIKRLDQNKFLCKVSASIGFLFLLLQLLNNLFFYKTDIITIRFPLAKHYGNQLIPAQIIICIVIMLLYKLVKVRIERMAWIIWLACFTISTLLFSFNHHYYNIEFLFSLLLLLFFSLANDLLYNTNLLR